MRIWGVDFRLEGLRLDSVVDQLMRRGVLIDDLTRTTHKAITGYVSLRDFRKIVDVAKKRDLTLSIARKRGLYAVYSAIKRRWPFAIMACAACVLLNFALSLVLSIEVYSDADAQLALTAVQNAGVHIGMPISSVDRHALEDILWGVLPDAAYIGVRARGTCIRVEVISADKPPNIASLYPPCDIVAAKDCVIESIRTISGKALVKPGDTVRAGQVIISGIQRISREEYKCVRAIGEVKGRVWYEGRGDAYFAETQRLPTGRVGQSRIMRFFDRRIEMHPPPEYADYDSIITRLPVGGLFLPISMLVDTQFEMHEVKIERDVANTRIEAIANAELNARAQCPDNAIIVDKWMDFSIIGGEGLRARVVFEAIEPIGRAQE